MFYLLVYRNIDAGSFTYSFHTNKFTLKILSRLIVISNLIIYIFDHHELNKIEIYS